MTYFLNEKIFFPIREWRLKELLFPHLGNIRSLLDVGCGNGRIAWALEKKLGVKVVGVDKLVQKNAVIPVKKYSGQTLPFADNSFDAVLLVDVVHHEVEQKRLIREARRVSRKYVLIKDHYWENGLDKILLKWADDMGNKIYGIALPYKFLNLQTWENLFKDCGLKVIYCQKIRDFFLGISFKNILFKLEK